MKIGSIRRTIRFLQIYPVITTLCIIVDIVLDTLNVFITPFICGFFGTSLFVTTGLYIISKALYVSTWSKSLYIALIAELLFDILDQFFHFNITAIIFNEIAMLIIGVGIIASFITFIYDKYKYGI